MSSLQDRKNAVAEAAAEVMVAEVKAKIALEKRYREGRGEVIGDAAGAFGAMVGSRTGRWMVGGAQTVIMLSVAGMLASLLL